METNLYVQIGTHLIKGRIIQSVYFHTTVPAVTVIYLCGRREYLKLDDFLDEEAQLSIYNSICDIHAQPCYPSSGSDGCECLLGVAKL